MIIYDPGLAFFINPIDDNKAGPSAVFPVGYILVNFSTNFFPVSLI